MDWIFDHFQVVIIIALALGSWVKHRAEAKAAEAEARRELEEGPRHDDGYDQEPEWTVPQMPPPLVRPPTPPPLQVDLAEIDAVLQHQKQLQDSLKKIKAAKAAPIARQAAVARPYKPIQTVVSGGSSLRAALRDPAQTRRAVVLREILGPPVGLR